MVVDGFDSFNAAHFHLLQLLSTQVGDLLITFPGAVESDRPAHRCFTDSISRLIKDLSPTVETIEGSTHLPSALFHIEQHLFDAQPISQITPENPILLEARSPADEAREALRWISNWWCARMFP